MDVTKVDEMVDRTVDQKVDDLENHSAHSKDSMMGEVEAAGTDMRWVEQKVVVMDLWLVDRWVYSLAVCWVV